MYNVYNPSECFYVWEIQKERLSLIGNENDFIDYLARGYNWWGGDNARFNFICHQNEYTPDKYYQYFRGEVCINPRDWEKQALSWYKKKYKNQKDRDYYKYWKKNKVYKGSFRQGPVEGIHKYRGGSGYRPPKTKHIFAMYANPEYKEYNRGTKKIIPKWWDDKIRQVEMNWKSQRKTKHQWKE